MIPVIPMNMKHDFKLGEEVIIYSLPIPGQEFHKEWTLGKQGKIVDLEHFNNWVAVEGVTRDGYQLWVHPAGVRRATKLDKALK